MIWASGRLIDDDALTIPALDRTFEHGLGLFETLRTWNARAPLLERHLARLTRSAQALGLPLDGVALPDAKAVSSMLAIEESPGDRLLRITLTGGISTRSGATLWMKVSPIPEPPPDQGLTVEWGAWPVVRSDVLARHKTLNYWSRRHAYESARARSFDETVSTTPDGNAWEGSRTNLFLVRRSTLLTPTLDGPIVPGIMRALVLKQADEIGLEVLLTEGLTVEELSGADEVFLSNSVRGLTPVRQLGVFRADAPGPTTRLLQERVSLWLYRPQ